MNNLPNENQSWPPRVRRAAHGGRDQDEGLKRALTAWRAAAGDRAKGLMDTALLPIIKERLATAEEISPRLTNRYRTLAPEIADVVRTYLDQQAQPGPALHPVPEVDFTPEHALDIDPDSFATYSFTAEQDPIDVTFSRIIDSGVTISWPTVEPPAPVCLYRVVTGDLDRPYAPEVGELVTTTDQTSVIDDRAFTGPLRHVTVWSNTGNTVQEALAAQPRLHAQGMAICPVRNLELREDEGRVIGSWEVWPGASRVRVYRIPIERAAHGIGIGKYSLHPDRENLSGFIDNGAERGRRYLYSTIVEAVYDGVTKTSPAASKQVQVSVALEPVTDLTVRLHGTEAHQEFDVRWTRPPAGRVVVYRSSRPPAPGIEDEVRDEQGLAGAFLAESDRLGYPVVALDHGRVGMPNVPWPRGWQRAFFTPVTLLDGKAYVGRTECATRVRQVDDVRLVERVSEQLLTFSWPEGADNVFVFRSPRGVDSDTALASRPYEVDYPTYERQGGVHLPGPLPEEKGCTLHLVAVAFQNGAPVFGPPTTIDYPGLLRIHYQVTTKRTLLGTPRVIGLEMNSSFAVEHPPPFALICNPDRFPLHIDDGVPIAMAPAGLEGATPESRLMPARLDRHGQPATWIADLDGAGWLKSGHPYYIRVFADLPPEHLARVAVLDPPISQLRLMKK